MGRDRLTHKHICINTYTQMDIMNCKNTTGEFAQIFLKIYLENATINILLHGAIFLFEVNKIKNTYSAIILQQHMYMLQKI